MKARQLIDGATFGPSAMKVMSSAFNDAWAEVEHGFDCDQIEAARVCLVRGILASDAEGRRPKKSFEEKPVPTEDTVMIKTKAAPSRDDDGGDGAGDDHASE
jgi:hypothetical protein